MYIYIIPGGNSGELIEAQAIMGDEEPPSFSHLTFLNEANPYYLIFRNVAIGDDSIDPRHFINRIFFEIEIHPHDQDEDEMDDQITEDNNNTENYRLLECIEVEIARYNFGFQISKKIINNMFYYFMFSFRWVL